jgi:hypothetical protein
LTSRVFIVHIFTTLIIDLLSEDESWFRFEQYNDFHYGKYGKTLLNIAPQEYEKKHMTNVLV